MKKFPWILFFVFMVIFIVSQCQIITHVPDVNVTYSATHTSLTLTVAENSECNIYQYTLRDLTWSKEITDESTLSSITFNNLNPGDEYEAVVYCGEDKPMYCIYVEKIVTPRSNDSTPPTILSKSVSTSKAIVTVQDIPSGVQSVQIRLIDDLEIPTILTYDLKYDFTTGKWSATYSLPHKGTWKYSVIVEDKSKNITEATGTINF